MIHNAPQNPPLCYSQWTHSPRQELSLFYLRSIMYSCWVVVREHKVPFESFQGDTVYPNANREIAADF